MRNPFKINAGTQRNTEEKKGVPTKKCSKMLFRVFIYIYGTLEHWNTTHDRSRMIVPFGWVSFLQTFVFLILNLLISVFRCSWCSDVDNQRLSGVPAVFQRCSWPQN